MDIQKCDGKDCIVKEKCKRFTATKSIPDWFIAAPFTIDKGLFKCEMFWGYPSDLLLEQLKSIMNGSKSLRE